MVKLNHANVTSGKQLYIRGNRGYGTGSSPENWKQLMVKLNYQHQATRLLLSQCYLCILNFGCFCPECAIYMIHSTRKMGKRESKKR